MNRGQQRLSKYNEDKHLLRKYPKGAETKYHYDTFENNKNSGYAISKSLNLIINPRKRPNSEFTINGATVTDKKAISDELNKHFCTVGETLNSRLPDMGIRYKEYFPTRINNSFNLKAVCKEDIELKKAPGPDSIGSKIAQCALKSLQITPIFKQTIQKSVHSHDMKLARVIGIHGKGTKYDPNNYKPISL